MSPILSRRAWPNSTIFERRCARTTWPFGELSERDLYITGGSLFVGVIALTVCQFFLSPRSFKAEKVAKHNRLLLTMMVVDVVCELLANITLWLVIQTLGCYVERVNNWVAYGFIFAKWLCLFLYLATLVCSVIVWTIWWKCYSEKKRAAEAGARGNEIEMQRIRSERTNTRWPWLKPFRTATRRPEDQEQGEETLPKYSELKFGDNGETV